MSKIEDARGEFLLSVDAQPVVDESFDGGASFHLRVAAPVDGRSETVFLLPLRTSFKTSGDVSRAVFTLMDAAHRINRARASATTIALAAAGLRRHGWATVRWGGATYSIPYIDDRAIYALVPQGAVRPSFAALRDAIAVPGSFPDELPRFDTRQVKSSIHMKESWSPFAEGMFPGVHTLGNLLALLDPFTHQGVDGFRELIHLLWVDTGRYNVGTKDTCISELRIHSHGNAHEISMGGEAKLADANFQQNGTVTPGTPLADLIDVLKRVMCKPSTIIFDACNAAQGTLLQNLSRNLGPNITVNGNTGIGDPLTNGDANFVNGVRV